MIKFIKSIFSDNKKDTKESDDTYMEQVKKDAELRNAEKEKQKSEWIMRNDLKKKIDQCYLGTRKTAFYGTYEEFMAEHNHGSLAAMQRTAYERGISSGVQGQVLGLYNQNRGNPFFNYPFGL